MKKIKSLDLVMWNGIDIELYSSSFDARCIQTVWRFLKTFKWDKRAEEALRYLIDRDGYNVVKQATRGKVAWKDKIQEFAPPRVVMGSCPKCGGILRGDRVKSCESIKTGRVSYMICDDCIYYKEFFIKNNELTIVEGE